MSFDIAEFFNFADDPMKVGIADDNYPVKPAPITVLRVLELRDTEIVTGTCADKDIFRTVFDRFTGKPLDHGRASNQVIPASELVRIEEFALQGAYLGMVAVPLDAETAKLAVLPPKAPEPSPPSPKEDVEDVFDPDACM